MPIISLTTAEILAARVDKRAIRLCSNQIVDEQSIDGITKTVDIFTASARLPK
jgi:hypothetical protein